MESLGRKQHWEFIYENRQPDEVSWYQPVPETSLEFIKKSKLTKKAAIIDVGGGESFLIDELLEGGFRNVTLLDISDAAIRHARQRVGDAAKQVNWLVTDILEFEPEELYDFWHDRATFHFLTGEPEIRQYQELVNKAVKPGGYLVIATFSESGPKRCSGLEIHQYSENAIINLFSEKFNVLECKREDHITPYNTVQNFLFCFFRKKK